MAQTPTINDLLDTLERCIKAKDKRGIIEVYSTIEDCVLDTADDETLDRYDTLVTKANKIVYE